MLAELIEKAKNIAETTDANISGAVNQVCKPLTIDEIETVYSEVFTPEKFLKKMRAIELARAGDSEAFYDLKTGVNNIILNRAR